MSRLADIDALRARNQQLEAEIGELHALEDMGEKLQRKQRFAVRQGRRIEVLKERIVELEETAPEEKLDDLESLRANKRLIESDIETLREQDEENAGDRRWRRACKQTAQRRARCAAARSARTP